MTPDGRRRLRRAAAASLAAVATVAVLGAGAVYGLSARRLARVHPVPAERVFLAPRDSASAERGRRLASSATPCTLCHGADFGGAVYDDAGPVGLFAGPNLTRGRGGVGGTLTDADWERAVRHGVDRDGHSLILMPSETFTYLTDEDLGAIVAWARRAPPVDRDVPRTHFRALGRALLAAGKLPLLVAEKTPRVDHPVAMPAAPTADYGRYLADIGGCRGCHGLGLSGGRVGGPDGLPPASNLTPAGLTGWTEADFMRALRTGRRPDGTVLDEFMPWRVSGRMTDAELHAIWLYLRSVPPRPFGNK